VRVVATAGHVDHGKSSLVLALTGTDPDRFAEEKERGLTIDLGFAFTDLPSGATVGFVDVPGHERFVKNMLAGVGAVDVALFVVAANEGWMPQSEEHLRILDVLGVHHGIVALTKADTVSAEALDDARRSVVEHLATSSLRDAPVVVCDSVSGRGLDDVRRALDAALAATPAAEDLGRPRLWIDRVFAPRGAGTVVTGTLLGGSVAVDDTLRVVRLDRAARVRAIESAHAAVAEVKPGARVALNLAGIERQALTRGDALVRAGQWFDATEVDVRITPIPGAPSRLPAQLRAAVGSGEHAARARVLGGDRYFARLQFDGPLPLAVGDRMVLRDPARSSTIAGAEVLDVGSAVPARRAAAALPRPTVARLLEGHGWLRRDNLARLVGFDQRGVDALLRDAVDRGDAVVVGEWWALPADVEALRDRARGAVREHHAADALSPGLELGALAATLRRPSEQLRAAFEGWDTLVVTRGVVHAPEHAVTAAGSDAGRALLAELDAAPFSPPAPADAALARALVREGALVDVDGILFTSDAIGRARAVLRGALVDGGSITVGAARELLGSTRKFVVPLLERFDREGFTRRRGDVRIAGPRLDAAGSDQP
jgi:selenocysteine-specific elongation factor